MRQCRTIGRIDRPRRPDDPRSRLRYPRTGRILMVRDDANRGHVSVDNRLPATKLLACFDVDLKAGCHQSGVMSVDRARLQRNIAAVVRRHRESTRLSQEAFADHIGMHRTQYSFVERGKRDFRLSTLERVARGLEKPVWVILREAEEDSGNPAGVLLT